MNPNVIQFACQHCQSWLTVPVQMAGVSGPCPKCGGHITSPQATPAPEFKPPTGSLWASPLAQPQVNLPPMPAVPAAPINPQAQAWASLPARPPTSPMPAPGADPGFFHNPAAASIPSAGMPSTPLQPSLLRQQPGGFPQGPAAMPPPAPSNPLAHAMAHLPMPQGTDQTPNASRPVSRPITVGGSRLSLLARQLTTAPDGTQHLPPAPQPVVTTGQLPRSERHPTTSMPRPSSAHMQDPNMRRGLNVTTRKRSSGLAKLFVAAVVLLGVVGAVGWQYRGPLLEVAAHYGFDGAITNALPILTTPTVPDIVPGVDEVPSPVVAQDTPLPKAPEPKAEVVTAPPAPSLTPAVRDLPAPPPLEEAPPKAIPVPDPSAVARRALPVDEPPTPAAMASKTETETTMPANVAAPLVEVGRAKDDPKLVPETLRPGMANGLDRPIVKNVPPACEPAAKALKSFLAANNWRERLAFMQLPGDMERKVQEYYASNSDGPVEVDEIEYYHHNESPQVGKGMHVVFVLRSRAWDFPMGVPVMVEVYNNEARVDWLTFVEFKDDLLNRFLTTYMEGPVRFHVGIRRTYYFEDDVPRLEEKNAFEVAPPMGNCHGYVFVPKDSPLARSLATTLSWDKDLSLGVVELQWRREGSQKWIEMTALPQLNWYSDGGSEGTSAPTSPVAKPPTGAPKQEE